MPLFGGLALIVVLIVYQFRARRPLLTIRTVLTSSIPVAGVGVALFAAAASVAATALTANVLLQTYSPVRVGLLYLPELGGAVVMAFVFGIVITRRAMHYLPLVGWRCSPPESWSSGSPYPPTSLLSCSARH